MSKYMIVILLLTCYSAMCTTIIIMTYIANKKIEESLKQAMCKQCSKMYVRDQSDSKYQYLYCSVQCEFIDFYDQLAKTHPPEVAWNHYMKDPRYAKLMSDFPKENDQ